MRNRVAREVTRINNYEFKCKIKTNKFQILSISKSKPATIINNNQLNYSNKITLEHLTGRCSISQHIIREKSGKSGSSADQNKKI